MSIRCVAGVAFIYMQLYVTCWCITGLMEPLGSTSQNWCGAKSLSMAVSIIPVDCVHLCQEHSTSVCALMVGRTYLQLVHSPSPPLLPPTHPPIYPLIHNMCKTTGVVKTISKTSSEYIHVLCGRVSYETVAIDCSTYTANLAWLQCE